MIDLKLVKRNTSNNENITENRKTKKYNLVMLQYLISASVFIIKPIKKSTEEQSLPIY